MNKTNLIKTIFILTITAMVILLSTSVFAADSSDNYTDLTNMLSNTNSSNTGAGNNTNTNSSNTNTSNTNTNSSNTNTNRSNTNNSSVYNNVDLPKTGIGDSIPVAMLIVIFAISAGYAYKKVKEYRNI